MNDATTHVPHEDLAIYAMQCMNGEESSTIALHVEQCPECRAELEAVRSDLAAYAMTAEMHSPPALARQRLLKQVSREKKFLSVADRAPAASISSRTGNIYDDIEDPPRRNVVALALPWVGWLVAAGVAVMALNLYHQRDAAQGVLVTLRGQVAHLTEDVAKARQITDALTDSSAIRVTLTKNKAPATPSGRVTYIPDQGTLLFFANNMEPLRAYKTYELWLIPADGRDPIPAGTFHPDPHGNASVIMPELPKGVIAGAFGITIEDEGGSKTPTKPIIMAGL
jgi:hypothetical protein